MTKVPTEEKPRLVAIGNHFLDPKNISGIKQAKEGLYIIMLRDQPEPEFPLWLTERQFERARKYFDIQGEE